MPKDSYKDKRKAVRGYSLSPENIAWIEASAPKGKQSDFVDTQLTAARENAKLVSAIYGTATEGQAQQ